MALNAAKSKNTGGSTGSAPTLEPDTYLARLVVVADLGLQAQRPYKGEEKPPAYEILTTYELVDQFMKDEDGNDIKDKPRWVSEKFALYPLTSDRATSTKRYDGIDPRHTAGGDWASLVGEACLLTLVNNPGSGVHQGKVFTNIANVGAVPSAMRSGIPPLVNDPVVFDMDDPDLDAFNALPEWVQNRIKEGLEFKGSALEGLLGGETEQSIKEAAALDAEEALAEDEVPF